MAYLTGYEDLEPLNLRPSPTLLAVRQYVEEVTFLRLWAESVKSAIEEVEKMSDAALEGLTGKHKNPSLSS